MLLAALVIADELSDANEALQQERSRARAADDAKLPTTPTRRRCGVHGIAQRIEAIAARLESP